MTVVQRKVCMLGATAVGKTSLVRRYVESHFSERYQATIGVKIDRKLVGAGDAQVSLLLWDLQGEDELHRVRTSYLRGASGLIYVVDGTRPETLETAQAIQRAAAETVGEVPAVVLFNKADLTNAWRLSAEQVAAPGLGDTESFVTSARSGDKVDEAFLALVHRIQGQ